MTGTFCSGQSCPVTCHFYGILHQFWLDFGVNKKVIYNNIIVNQLKINALSII